ncbi:MAG: FMN-binding protein [Bacteroidota bacterium]|nr:FMN-binding protein [Bacteroidota bacterium]
MNTGKNKFIVTVLVLAISLVLKTNTVSAQHHDLAMRGPQPEAVLSALEMVKTVFTDAASVSEGNTIWHVIKNAKGKLDGYALSSRPLSKDIIGYKGPTPVVLILDKNKIIKKLFLLENKETPGYINKVKAKGFLDTWNGKTLKEAAQLDVDAVSGATYSSTAIKRNVAMLAISALQTKP